VIARIQGELAGSTWAEFVMPMSEEEQRRLRELEGQLDQQRRMVRLARQLSAASVYTGTRRISVLWIAGGALGLILFIAGAVAHVDALLAAGVIIVAGTLMIAGVAAIVVEVRGSRREDRGRLLLELEVVDAEGVAG
jgi:hypothetical protein